MRANINCVAFPDDGAAKRFKDLFTDELEALPGLTIVICGKVRDGDRRIVDHSLSREKH